MSSATAAESSDLSYNDPARVYHNLLIFEHSLRQQYLELRARRQKYLLFTALLFLWTAYFAYAVWIAPSPYSYIALLNRICLSSGLISGMLFRLTGLYHKTLVYPRRFMAHTNKGLRQFHVRLVQAPWMWWEWPWRRRRGGASVKLVVLGKVFASDFREGWELYRTAYWERENQRREELRKSGTPIGEAERDKDKEAGRDTGRDKEHRAGHHPKRKSASVTTATTNLTSAGAASTSSNRTREKKAAS